MPKYESALAVSFKKMPAANVKTSRELTKVRRRRFLNLK
jgi:hypothetical protein